MFVFEAGRHGVTTKAGNRKERKERKGKKRETAQHRQGEKHLVTHILLTVGSILCLVALGIAAYRISEKAGYPGLVGLAMLFPVFNFVLLMFAAFAKWPVERRAEQFLEERNQALRELRELRGEASPANQ